MKLYTKKAVASWLNLTETRIRQLHKEGILSEERPGLYDLQTATHEYIEYLRRGGSEKGDIDYNAEKAKLIMAKREVAELELHTRKGDLHSTEDVEKVMTDTLTKFRAHMMAIPAKLSPTLAKKTSKEEIFRLLKASIDEALEELSDFGALFEDIEVKEDEENDI